jgi:transcriptional regulator with XRE-family HTH domain
MVVSTIGTSLRAARVRLGWSREALAYHSGVSWSAIAQIESGRRTDLRLSSLLGLARALGVSIDYLAGNAAAAPRTMLKHRLLVYGSDDEFLAAVAPFLREGVERSEALLVVTSPARIELVRHDLGDDAGHVEFADAADWYQSPLEALQRYHSFLDGRLEAGSRWVRIIGEPVWAGRSAAQIRQWTRYESIINVSFATSPATFVCPYDTESVPAKVVLDARCTHPECMHAGGSAANPSYREPEDFLLQLG